MSAKDFKILSISFAFLFSIFCSYSILKPLRDTLATVGALHDIKWLFMATFIFSLVAVFAGMYLSARVKRGSYIVIIFLFFTLNIFLFYIFFISYGETLWGARVFFVWASVFNLFVISTGFLLLADRFDKDTSKRLFGIIFAGASLGSIIGALFTSLLSKFTSIENLLLVSALLLLIAAFLSTLLLKGAKSKDLVINPKNPFNGISLILKSKYLLLIAGFILLTTAANTFLYIEQARVVKLVFHSREERVSVFANIDFIVQTLSLLIQIFFTGKVAKRLGISFLLVIVPLVLAFGFVVIAFSHPIFYIFVIFMIIRRVGEYAFIKPGREMTFVVLSEEEKYRTKSFFDTALYRFGDMGSSWLESLLSHIGVKVALFGGAFLCLLWAYNAFMLSRFYKKR
ncbi:hypothetical protein BKH43_03230 [Helicobacter sp. 13S00401-1]|nr:hypothetical protein BKH43_03230 [Helicobacter sp. 13S00401-1]